MRVSFQRGQIRTAGTRSAHSRGSTVDLGLVPSAVVTPAAWDPAAPLRSCFAPKGTRFEDGAIDFGTGYDCLDTEAGTAHAIVGANAVANRQLLRGLMERAGFKPYSKEWWHFELKDEPFPAEVASVAQVSLRQLQWWDSHKLLKSSVATSRSALAEPSPWGPLELRFATCLPTACRSAWV